MISRRALLGSLASLPFLAHAPSVAQGVGGARIMVRDNRLWMPVRFGERGPYSFIIDTGAFVSLIRLDVAQELGLRQQGAVRIQGVGGVDVMMSYQARGVMLGSVNIGNADFAGYDPRSLPIHPEAHGAISAGLLTVEDSDLDFEAGEWRMYLGGRGDRPGYELLPSRIGTVGRAAGAPPLLVEASISGRTYRLQVDTGAPGQLLLSPRATRRSGLWNDETPFAPHRRSGIGGVGARARLVRGPEVGIGGIRFERPLISLTDPGTALSIGSDGILGLELLQCMNLSTDVRAGRLWARRNALPAPPGRYGPSGLWVEQRGDRLVAAVVSPQSPASEAGLRAGDEIRDVPMGTLIEQLNGRPGDSFDIAYRRDRQARTARLTLREFL